MRRIEYVFGSKPFCCEEGAIEMLLYHFLFQENGIFINDMMIENLTIYDDVMVKQCSLSY